MENLQKSHFTFLSAQDGLSLDALLLTPPHPKAVLQIAHGMCEHKERYVPFMEYMSRSGFACVIHDHRGHGKSIRRPEDLGYFYENGGAALVEDLYQLTKESKQKFPNLPYFLFGHSMGSLAVRCYAKKYDKAINGLVICGCPSNNPMAGMGLMLDKILQKFKGPHARSRIVDTLFSQSFEKPFRKERRQHAWVCSDSKVVEAYNSDPLCSFTFTLNGYESLLWLVRNTYSTQGWAVENPSLPILFLSGENDPCMLSKEKFQEAVSLMQKLGYRNVSHRLYPGMRHEILNESGKEKVYADVEAFYKMCFA